MKRKWVIRRKVGIGVERFNHLLDGLEKRWWGRWFIVLLVGVILVGLATINVAPGVVMGHHGNAYAKLSESPFDLSLKSKMQYRIFSPLVGHVLWLRGDNFRWVSIIAGSLFLSAVYSYARGEKVGRSESFGIAAMMAFSITVAAVLHHPGFVDTMSYLLLALVMIYSRQLWLWPVFYLMALFNHERNLVAAPWIFLWILMNEKKMRRYAWSLGLLGVSITLMWWWHDYVLVKGFQVDYSLGFYLNAENIKRSFEAIRGWVVIGSFAAFRLFWFFPLYAIYRLSRLPGKRLMAGWLLLVIAGAAGQLIVAWDITRLMGLAWPAIMIGALETRKLWGARVFKRRLWLLIAVSFLMPNYMLLGPSLLNFHSLPVALFYRYVLDYNIWANPWFWF